MVKSTRLRYYLDTDSREDNFCCCNIAKSVCFFFEETIPENYENIKPMQIWKEFFLVTLAAWKPVES